MPKIAKTNWKTVAGLLLLGALAALPAGYLVSLVIIGAPHDFVKPAYLQSPLPIELHGVSGILFWLLMPFQFSPRIRQRWPNWHQISGRIAVLSAIVLGASAIWLVAFFPHVGGVFRNANLAVSGAGTIAAFGYALWLVRTGKIAMHRVWMMRAVAITYGAATTAIVGIPVFLIFGDFPVWLSEIDRWAGLMINLAFVEWVLRRKSSKVEMVSGVGL